MCVKLMMQNWGNYTVGNEADSIVLV